MKLLNIKLTDFLAYAGTHELDLSNIQSAVICGPNEAGKSSLIDAILYALSGQARKRPEELINETTDKMSVIINFSQNNNIYRIERTQKGAKQSLKIEQDGNDISERLLTATQKKLDKIIGVSYELLLVTAITQQEEINKLSTMTPSDREKILCEMLGINQWETKKKLVNEKLNNYKNLDDDIKVLEKDSIDANVRIGFIHDECNENKNSLKTLLELKETKENTLNTYEKQVLESSKFKLLEAQKYTLTGEINSLEARILLLTKQEPIDITTDNIIVELEENKNLLNEVLELKTKATKTLEHLKLNRNEVLKHYHKQSQTTILNNVPCVGMDIHDKCILLNSALVTKKEFDIFLKSQNSDNIEELKLSIDNSISNTEQEVISYDDSKHKLEGLINQNKIKLTEITNEINRQKDIEVIKGELTTKKEKLHDITEKLKEKPEINLAEYQQVKGEVAKLSQQIQDVSVIIGKLQTELDYINKSINTTKEKLNGLYDRRATIANYKTLYQAYSDIPTLLFEQAIPILEQYTNETLSKICPGEVIQLRSFRETKSNTLQKSLDVVSSTGRDFMNKCGSEKVRQSLALRLALSRYISEQNNMSIPFFIIDEGGIGSLDDNNVATLKLTLQEIANKFQLFLIITHLTELKDLFDTQILINPSGKVNKIQVINNAG